MSREGVLGTTRTDLGQSFLKWCPGYNPRRCWVSELLGQRDRFIYLKSYYYSIGDSIAPRVAACVSSPVYGMALARGPSGPVSLFPFKISELGGTGLGQSFLGVSRRGRLGQPGQMLDRAFERGVPATTRAVVEFQSYWDRGTDVFT